MTPSVVIAATLDTKSDEIGLVVSEFRRHGVPVCLVDCGVLGRPGIVADISREEVAQAAGADVAALAAAADRAVSIRAMISGLRSLLTGLLDRGEVAGFFGIGGGTNAALAAAAFEVMPFGLPKMLVTTIASGNTRPFVGMKDVTLVHTVVDVLGHNAFLREVIARSVAAMTGMLRVESTGIVRAAGVRSIGLTAFGSTTFTADLINDRLVGEGHEVLTFHARGTGGLALETFIRDGRIDGVIDLTTTELADEIVGGVCSAGPDRLRAAAAAGLPQVILPGAIDMVNFGPRETLPPQFASRTLLAHTPNATLMRTTPEENREIATFMAQRLNEATGPVHVLIPRGFSAYDKEGAAFWDPEADAAFVATLRQQLAPRIAVTMLESHINSEEVAAAACDNFLELAQKHSEGQQDGPEV